ncbi:hypothetical protein X777_15128 [Ooceraea biroi]|uniref:Uncharacterized protein n=1 Tax=Ooceraea biroi TaxID=2015173 RepID=A0A026VVS7_OOCBI|nr:hypothetical protein X777_15128 [Ooceraea biroi]
MYLAMTRNGKDHPYPMRRRFGEAETRDMTKTACNGPKSKAELRRIACHFIIHCVLQHTSTTIMITGRKHRALAECGLFCDNIDVMSNRL